MKANQRPSILLGKVIESIAPTTDKSPPDAIRPNLMYLGCGRRMLVGDMKKCLQNYPDDIPLFAMWEFQFQDIKSVKCYTFGEEKMLVFDVDIS